MSGALPGYRTLSPEELILISTLKTVTGTDLLKALSDVRLHVSRQRSFVAKLRQIADTPVVDLEALKAVGVTEFNRPWADIRGELYQGATAELKRIDDAQPERWIAIANTHFQEGLMALVRAVAQPEGF